MNPTTDLDGWLTVSQVAQRLALNEETIRRRIRERKIPGALYVGRIWLIPGSYMEGRDVTEAAPADPGQRTPGTQHA
jgi:excisionase family DNA binding protein